MADDRFIADQELTLSDYQGFSGSALIAFLIAVGTAVIGLVNHDWLFVNCVAILFALVVLVRLHRSGTRIGGRFLAIFAFAIPFFVVAAATTYDRVRTHHLIDVSRQHTATWLRLAQESRMYETYQLMLDYSKRKKPGSDLVALYGEMDRPSADFANYLSNEPERSLREDGSRAKLILVGVQTRKSELLAETFINQVLYLRPGESEPRAISIYMKRVNFPAPHGPQWSVEAVLNRRPEIPRVPTSEQAPAQQ